MDHVTWPGVPGPEQKMVGGHRCSEAHMQRKIVKM